MKIDHETFMQEAIAAAHESGENGEYPIGAVIVKDGKVISIGHVVLRETNDPVDGHAEVNAIRKATKELNSRSLGGCTLYSTHEPCSMCASAAFWAKIDTIVFSVSREDMIEHMKKKEGNNFSWRQIDLSCKEVLDKGRMHDVEVIGGVLKEEGLKLFCYTSNS